MLFAAGLLAASPDRSVSVTALAIGAAAAAFAGDTLGYLTGYRLGRPWLTRRTARFGDSLERAEALSARWGWWALVVARFIPWVRTFTPILAGVTRMRFAAFAGANLVGALVWGAGLVLLGYFAHSLAAAQPALRPVDPAAERSVRKVSRSADPRASRT